MALGASVSASGKLNDHVPRLAPLLRLMTTWFQARRFSTWVVLGLVLLSVAVLIKNAWVAEDAFIVFRVIEQLWAGNGPVFNAGERVQAYTSPLWFLLLAVGRVATADPFVLVLAVSLALWFGILWALHSIVRDRGSFALAVLALLSSFAFFDFVASGLENPLAYLTILLALRAYFAFLASLEAAPAAPSRSAGRRTATDDAARHLRMFMLWVGVTLCVRHDLLTLLGLPALFVLLQARRRLRLRPIAPSLLIGATPLAGWTAFSFLYYGFPFPNTAYAKLATGIPRNDLLVQGGRYLLDTTRFDPMTTIVLVGALLLTVEARTPAPLRVLGGGIAANLAYVVWVGGDFMRGRFLSFAFTVALAVCLLALRELGSPRLRRRCIQAAVLVLLVSIVAPWPRTPLAYPPRDAGKQVTWGIADERAYYFDTHGVLHNLFSSGTNGTPRFHRQAFAQQGLEFRASPVDIAVADNVGTFAYLARLDQHIIDRLGLTDPLLARLPSLGTWRIGHFRRWLPAGSLDRLRNPAQTLVDPDLASADEALQLVTRGRLWSRPRWREIVRLNLGRYATAFAQGYQIEDPAVLRTAYDEDDSFAATRPANGRFEPDARNFEAAR